MKLEKKPNKTHIREIESWLIEEYNQTGMGFYHNWETIINGLSKGQVFCLLENNKAIGFILWRGSEKVITIDIATIKIDKRGKGLGRQMIKLFYDSFKFSDYMVIDLQCSPESSEKFWSSIGFKKYKIYSRQNTVKMFGLLSNTLKCTEQAFLASPSIELWDVEPFESDRVEPHWCWNVDMPTDSGKLFSAIIQPCNPDWRMRYVKSNGEIIDDKIKYFPNAEEILCEGF
jgi:predicted GNAT family acetyltransferase